VYVFEDHVTQLATEEVWGFYSSFGYRG
jgi:hypothetical protein